MRCASLTVEVGAHPAAPHRRAGHRCRPRCVRPTSAAHPPERSSDAVLDPFSSLRRGLLMSLPAAAALAASPGLSLASTPVLEQPMTRLRLPEGAVGRDYVLVQLKVQGKGPYDFMVDSGLTAELITPHLRQALGIPASSQRLETGLGAGGSVGGMDLVTLQGAELVGAEGRALPPLTAVVTDFVQEHLDPAHDPVEGMLGMELLQLFDLDLDFPAARIRLWEPGTGTAAAAAAGLAEVPAAVLNETGVLGIRATTPGGASGQPFVGIVDCGASFSALNWQAAKLAGLPPKGDRAYKQHPPIYGVGVDGKPQQLPSLPVPFTFAGAVVPGQKAFEPPPPGWRPWEPVLAAVGELPVFGQLLGDGRSAFRGPAALIGLDVLSQRRVVLGAGAGRTGRARQLFVSKA